MALREKLRRWQAERKLTNREAATKLGTKERTYSDWKSGKHAPRGFALKHLLSILSVLLIVLSASSGTGTITFKIPSNSSSFSITTSAGAEISYVTGKPEVVVDPIPIPVEIIPASRRIDWTLTGIPGGIPIRETVFRTLLPGASLSAVQSVLNSCPENQVVKLSAGNYVWDGNLDWFSVRDGVVLRGDGPDKTKITFTAGSILMRHYFQESTLSVDANLSVGALKGATTVTLSPVPPWVKLGHIYLIDQLNDPAIAKTDGQENGLIYRRSLGNGDRGIGQTVKVVSKTATTVTFEVPLYLDYPLVNQPQLAQSGYDPMARTPLWQCGIEDLALTFTYANGGVHAIRMENCDGCWIRNVVSVNSPGGCHVWTVFSYRCEIRDSVFDGSHLHDAGQGYGVALYHISCGFQVENNTFKNLHVAMQVNYGSSGNVFGYNRSLGGRATSGQAPAINAHGCHAYMNLFEGNDTDGKVLGDFTHGSSSHNTLFRNQVLGYQLGLESDPSVIRLQGYNRKWNIIGNRLGKQGYHNVYEGNGRAIFKLEMDSPEVMDLLRHGNYDVVTSGIVWDSSIASRVLPDSLYLTGKPSWLVDKPWPLFDPLNP